MKKLKNKKGFTLAEVLITLAIIGVLAAILFPSILANYTERTLKAKRSAFVARMSQAMAELSNQFANYEDVTCTNPNVKTTCTDNDSAIKFLNEGLSKVYKLAAVCDRDSLDACDIPDNITKQNGDQLSLYSATSSMKGYTHDIIGFTRGSSIQYKDLLPAGFMTKNGETGIVFVNPTCSNKTVTSIAQEALFCMNMIFDLNGAKGKPNKVGEDIWFLTAFYPDSPTVAAPRMYGYDDLMYENTTDASTGEIIKSPTMIPPSGIGPSYAEAVEICASKGENVTLASVEDGIAIQLNMELLTDLEYFKTNGTQWHSTDTANYGGYTFTEFWTSTPCGVNYHYFIETEAHMPCCDNDLVCASDTTKSMISPLCVYDD